MKKIAIITFHSANNYGAVLQALSLQNYLNAQKNVQCKIIDYRSDYIEKDYTLNPFNIKERTIRKMLGYTLRLGDIYSRNRTFQSFRKKYFCLSRRCVSINEVLRGYDKVIAGSDQIWNFSLTQNDESYILNHISDSIQKYSYAASTGDYQFTESQKEIVRDALLQFRQISVREEKTKHVIADITGRNDICVTLDPVFLTSKESWEKLAVKPRGKKYILFFRMGYSPLAEPAMHFAYELSKKTGFELLLLWDQEKRYQYREFQHIHAVGPAEFLGYILNAEYVITNSFHATVFSIIFNIPFYTETIVDRRERIVNLLSLFGLEDRGLVNGCLKEKMQFSNEINWNKCNRIMEEELSVSKKYLEKVINED